jgi:hypothetical protein
MARPVYLSPLVKARLLPAGRGNAVETGLRADDPTRDVRAIRVKSDGFHSWTDAEIAQFEKRHSIARLNRPAQIHLKPRHFASELNGLQAAEADLTQR